MPGSEERVPASERDEDGAPWPLRWVEELVNTRVALYGTDGLTTAEAVADWLSAWHLASEGLQVDADGHGRVLRVREGLRALLVANDGERSRSENAGHGEEDDAAPRSALDDLTVLTGDLGLRVDVASTPPRLVPLASAPVDGALGRILAAVVLAVENGTWGRLKVCRNSECRYAYYDHSRNRSRAWCSMETCGNRAKVRAFRDRK